MKLAAAVMGASLAVAAASAMAAQGPAKKVLRYAFPAAETGFDPAKVIDLYSRIVNSHIFEAPYKYDYLARPVKIKPNTAAAMPEVSQDFRTWTIRLKPGTYFADDAAFKGRKRELVAEDYVYSWKRCFDPAIKSSCLASFSEEGVLGMEALREEALKSGKPLDYDKPVEGIRALDRYTFQFKLAKPRPRFLYTLADHSPFGATAREVIEAYGENSMAHPVGTGPFMLKQWRRSSLMVFERNPNFREMTFDGEPAADDAEGQAILAKLKGKRLPMVDRVEVSVIDEGQPRLLAFLNGEFDLLYPVPGDLLNQIAPGGKLTPALARRGMRIHRRVASDFTFIYFNMEDPVVGGYTPDKVALRRAMGLAYDVMAEIRQVRRGQGIPAQSIVLPGTYGYDPDLKTEASDHDLARARALLDMYGYVDRDGDGWRDLPDGRPLTIDHATQPDSIYRAFDEVTKKAFDAINVRVAFKPAQFPEQLKASRAGKLMSWSLGSTATQPDFQEAFQTLYGPAAGSFNYSRFKLPQFDALYEQMQMLPDGPERLALMRQAQKLAIAYAPYRLNTHRVLTDSVQPWLIGFRRPMFGRQLWHYVDIDTTRIEAR